EEVAGPEEATAHAVAAGVAHEACPVVSVLDPSRTDAGPPALPRALGSKITELDANGRGEDFRRGHLDEVPDELVRALRSERDDHARSVIHVVLPLDQC